MALINHIDKISSGTDSNTFNIGICIDLSKSFDTIDQTNYIIFPSVNKKYNIPPQAIQINGSAIYKLQLGLLMHKPTRQAIPNSISTLFQRNMDIHNYNTRNSNDYFMHEALANTGKFTIKSVTSTIINIIA